MSLRWIDEGDGYHHAHEGDAECATANEDADFVVTDANTMVSINNLPPMPPDQARRLVEKLYDMAWAEIRRAEGSETK